jgi:hypothetical protein
MSSTLGNRSPARPKKKAEANQMVKRKKRIVSNEKAVKENRENKL